MEWEDKMGTQKISRLQIGISDPKFLPIPAVEIFADGTWINLGEESDHTPARKTIRSILWNVASRIRRIYNPVLREQDRIRREQWNKTQKSIQLMPFWWGKGSALPFRDNVFVFVFSEHFFEHIFMDEAYELFVECKRVMKPGGVMRISVPDADLRTYAGLEPLVFDAQKGKTSNLDWNHPDIHKTRWNIYSLSILLELAGFRVIPLVYCDRYGNFHSNWPEKYAPAYPESTDWGMVVIDQYIKRGLSLIVDAILSNE